MQVIDGLETAMMYSLNPTSEELAETQLEIQAHEDSIKDLDDRMLLLLIEIKVIEESQKEHKLAISRLKGRWTWARRIPQELLIYIFEICIMDGWSSAPLVASQVCSSWRKAASCPWLWSRIYIDCDKSKCLAKLSFWLGMAHRSLLHITFRVRHNFIAMSGLLVRLLETIPRWRSLTVDAANSQSAGYILSHCSTLAPNLGELVVYVEENLDNIDTAWQFDENEVPGRIPGFQDAFRRAPKLVSLQLTSDVIQAPNVLPPQLQHLKIKLNASQYSIIRPVFLSELVAVLAGLPDLQSFHFILSYTESRQLVPSPMDQTVSLERLHSLILEGPTVLLSLLRNLAAPRLRVMRLRNPDDSTLDDEIKDGLVHFMRRVVTLRILELHELQIPEADLISCLGLQYSLEELRLHGLDIADGFIFALRESIDFCPKLTTLDLRWCGRIHGQPLTELVQDRDQLSKAVDGNVSPLVQLTLVNCASIREDHILSMAQHVVCLLYPDGDFCKSKGCCENSRYRRRFFLRHAGEIRDRQIRNIKLAES